MPLRELVVWEMVKDNRAFIEIQNLIGGSTGLKQMYDQFTEIKYIYNPEYLIAKFGYRELLDKIIKGQQVDFNRAMIGAAEGGHMDIVIDMIRQGQESFQEFDFEDGMVAASTHGDMDILQEMIRLGRESGQYLNFDFNLALSMATEGNHQDIIRELIRLGADNFMWAVEGAATGGHLDLVIEMIKRAIEANQELEFQEAILLANASGHINIANYIKNFQQGYVPVQPQGVNIYSRIDKLLYLSLNERDKAILRILKY